MAIRIRRKSSLFCNIITVYLIIFFPQGRKTWERFHEIPDWIDAQSSEQGVAPTVIIAELEEMRMQGKKKTGLNALSKELKRLRGLRKQEVNAEVDISVL